MFAHLGYWQDSRLGVGQSLLFPAGYQLSAIPTSKLSSDLTPYPRPWSSKPTMVGVVFLILQMFSAFPPLSETDQSIFFPALEFVCME